jgi:aspartyl-tRNA synthetase
VKPPRANLYRDAWAGSLDAGRAGDEVRLAGWVHRRRDHGGLIFIDLRDRTGLVQLVFHPETAPEAHAAAGELRSEHVIGVRGEVVRREAGRENPALATGEIEVAVVALEHLASAEPPPFPLDDGAGSAGEAGARIDEAIRLRDRALDLRRPPMQRAIELRHAVVQAMRGALHERDFLEIETPMLTRSTPEGARDFLVPARVDPGAFYALPQSPQLFKQLLMVAGFERYYQIVRCFRDEDTRADRQPEFTQLDVEMSFVDEEDVIEMMEAVMAAVFGATAFPVAGPPWPRVTFSEAMLRFGSDRPDTRFGLEIADVGAAVARTEFKVFAGALVGGGVVRGINAGAREVPRSELDELTELAKRHRAKGLVWAFVGEGGEWRSPVAKFLSAEERHAVGEALHASPGDLLLLVADDPLVAAEALGAVRLRLRDKFELVPPGTHDVLWVTDFPMFTWSETEGRWAAEHHPFTAPVGDLNDPATALSRGYDLVLDGNEIGGGSIRIHRRDVQERVFAMMGIDHDEAQDKFGFLLDAFTFGAPPHGGIAFGWDRITALLAGTDSIREVIAFPKSGGGVDPLTDAPAPITAQQRKESGIDAKPKRSEE